MLIRSEGRGPTYRAADVVYLDDKLGRGFDRAIYVLGADHHGTRNWYAAVARMLGHDPERIEVLLYQLVNLTRGGAATKMSKRRGDVVFLDDFLDEIGVDAARWYLVSRGPTRRSRSTSTSPRSARRRTPSTTSSTRTPGSPGSCATPGDATPSAEPPAELAAEERDLDQAARRVSRRSSPRRPRAAARTRSRPTRSGSPTTSTASTTSTRCSAPRPRLSASASAPPRGR